ncbi:hypothetical protein [Paraburkholderia caribensis]|uniref:hypothetical protein n=1 Tax=Paraburkholderia caribensis TaxID=75105 RepID=UPI001CB50EF0|nr:hypothetical protein [Paraburkholderia caribensis]CAG9261133.1 hypothetical protein PCAR4_510078 [Paraburkholderia caribensis]
MVTEHERLLQALHDGAATPPPYRVNHAKGVLLQGYFVATRQAALLLAVRRRVYDLAFCRRHTS